MASIANLSVMLSANPSGFIAGLGKAEKAISGFASHMDGIATKVLNFGGIAAGAIGGLSAVAAVKWGVETAAGIEQASIAFEVLLGDAAKGKALFSSLQDLAVKTPFSQEAVVKSAQGLAAFGFSAKDIVPILTMLGDQAAAMPNGMEAGLEQLVRAIGQMKSAGKATTEDLNQLISAGVPVWDMLSKATGKSVSQIRKDVENGAVSSGTAIEALLSGMQSRTKGMMDRQSQTLSGLWSSLKDNAALALADVVSGIIEALDVKNGMQGMIDGLANIRSRVQEFMPTLKAYATSFISFAKNVGSAIGVVWQVLQEGWNRIASLFDGISLGDMGIPDVRDMTLTALQFMAEGVAAFGAAIEFTFGKIAFWWKNAIAESMKGALAIKRHYAEFMLNNSSLDATVKHWEGEVERLGQLINKVEAARQALKDPDLNAIAQPKMQRVQDFFAPMKLQADMAKAAAFMEKVFGGKGNAGAEQGGGFFGGLVRQVDALQKIKNLDVIANAPRAAAEEIAKVTAELQKQIETVGLSKEGFELHRLAVLGATAQELNAIAQLQAELQQMQEAQQAWEEGARVHESVKTSFEKFEDQLQRLKELWEEGTISTKDYERAVDKAADAMIRSQQVYELKPIMAGSQEAYSHEVQRWAKLNGLIGGGDKEVEKARTEAKEQMKEQNKRLDKILKELERIGLPVIANIR